MYELDWTRDQNHVKPKGLLIIFDHVPLTVPTKIHVYPCELCNIGFFLLIFTHEKSHLELLVLLCFYATRKR